MATFKEETSQTELKLRVLPSALSKIAMLDADKLSIDELLHSVANDANPGSTVYWDVMQAVEIFGDDEKTQCHEYDEVDYKDSLFNQWDATVTMHTISSVKGPVVLGNVYLGADWKTKYNDGKYDSYASDLVKIHRLMNDFKTKYSRVNAMFKYVNGKNGWIQTKVKAHLKRQLLTELINLDSICVFHQTAAANGETYQPITLGGFFPADLTGGKENFKLNFLQRADPSGPCTLVETGTYVTLPDLPQKEGWMASLVMPSLSADKKTWKSMLNPMKWPSKSVVFKPFVGIATLIFAAYLAMKCPFKKMYQWCSQKVSPAVQQEHAQSRMLYAIIFLMIAAVVAAVAYSLDTSAFFDTAEDTPPAVVTAFE
eukprot:534858_1